MLDYRLLLKKRKQDLKQLDLMCKQLRWIWLMQDITISVM